MQVKGKIYELGATIQATESLKKREVILEYIENPQYPEYLKFEAIQDRTALLDTFRVGQDVELFFNLKGRPWTDKTGKKSYFNSLQLWKIVALDSSQAAPTYTPPAADTSSSNDDDDLPF